MSEQYIYGQPKYSGTGGEFGTYQSTNYQQGKTKAITRQPISYETYEQQQQGYYGQNQPYTQQVYVQRPNQGNQVYNYASNNEITGYNNYYQVQQETHQQMIPQSQAIPQSQSRKAKIVNQMVQQKQGMQNMQPPFASRNPHMRQQYQQQQAPLIQKQYSGHFKQQEEIYDNQDQFNQPQIEPDFQPEVPIANSVLNQSKIPFQQNQVRITPAYNPQVQTNPSYVVPRRNPNVSLKQYDYYGGDSHFVNTADPGLSTIQVNNQNPSQIQKQNSSSIQKRISGQLSQKSSGRIQNSLENEPSEQPEIGTGISNFGPNIGMSGMSGMENVKQSEVENVGLSGLKTVEPIMESKTNEEYEKENPIEEKVPDQSHVDDLNNQNEGFPQQLSQNPSQIADIDENLDHLPTINSIMKGNSEMLPPPKKKKYK